MNLTRELKGQIDELSYGELLRRWRFAPVGDAMFQGESGEYWRKRMSKLRRENPAEHVRASKALGW